MSVFDLDAIALIPNVRILVIMRRVIVHSLTVEVADCSSWMIDDIATHGAPYRQPSSILLTDTVA